MGDFGSTSVPRFRGTAIVVCSRSREGCLDLRLLAPDMSLCFRLVTCTVSLFLLQTCRPARLGTQTPATCRWKMAPRMGGFLISVTHVTVRSSYLVRDMRNCVGYCYFGVALFRRVPDVLVRD